MVLPPGSHPLGVRRRVRTGEGDVGPQRPKRSWEPHEGICASWKSPYARLQEGGASTISLSRKASLQGHLLSTPEPPSLLTLLGAAQEVRTSAAPVLGVSPLSQAVGLGDSSPLPASAAIGAG